MAIIFKLLQMAQKLIMQLSLMRWMYRLLWLKSRNWINSDKILQLTHLQIGKNTGNQIVTKLKATIAAQSALMIIKLSQQLERHHVITISTTTV